MTVENVLLWIKGHFFHFNTDFRISVCSSAQYLMCVIGRIKVHLIHSKRVPFLHNTVLTLCYEGDRLVAVLKRIPIMWLFISVCTVDLWTKNGKPSL